MTTQRPNVQTREGQEQMKAMGIKPIPVPDEMTQPYWDAAKKHELRIRRCKSCSEFQHPPREACVKCGGKDFDWTLLSGKGTVYAFIIDRRLMVPGFDEPFVIAQINPVEAGSNNLVRITANVKDCELSDVYVGMPVELFYESRGEFELPQFRPAPEAKLKSRGG